LGRFFRINSPPVVAETLDGEATIVDLESGTYYALNESGTFVWEELGRGTERDSIPAALADRYGLGKDEAGEAVEALVSELLERKLISPLPDGDAPVTNGAAASAAGIGRSYSTPKLSAYTDMQELLLLDPVHEVDAAGWPSRG
jgi:outer membrane protein assembly factor BamB